MPTRLFFLCSISGSSSTKPTGSDGAVAVDGPDAVERRKKDVDDPCFATGGELGVEDLMLPLCTVSRRRRKNGEDVEALLVVASVLADDDDDIVFISNNKKKWLVFTKSSFIIYKIK